MSDARPDTRVLRVPVVRLAAGGRVEETDKAAVEEPLEIRVNGEPFAVIMRTPGADRELAAGFLYAERVVRAANELATIEHCVNDERPDLRNVVNVTVAGAGLRHRLGERRRVVTGSSCGLCGRVTIESLRVEAPAVAADWRVAAALVAALPERLRAVQPAFDETGGLHAAGLFDREGRPRLVAEDVGRHNAVDKVVGRMLMDECLPLSGDILVVSGRTSYEIVQKAFLAGIPIVAAVSAPSSLAIELAGEAGITLLGFVRGGSFNVYANGQRIE